MRQPISEDQLKEGLRKGESAILEIIYQRYFERTATWVGSNQGTREDASDLFQEALTAIYLKLRDPEFQIQHQLGTYLYAICRNLWLKRLRDDRLLHHASEEGLDELVGEEAVSMNIQTQEEQLYRAKFTTLPAQCQELLRRFLEGESMKNIVENMNLSSIGYAKKRKFQCKEQLIKVIKADPQYAHIQHAK